MVSLASCESTRQAISKKQCKRLYYKSQKTSNEDLVKMGLWEGQEKLANKWINRRDETFWRLMKDVLNSDKYSEVGARGITLARLTIEECKQIEKNSLRKATLANAERAQLMKFQDVKMSSSAGGKGLEAGGRQGLPILVPAVADHAKDDACRRPTDDTRHMNVTCGMV